MLPALVAGVLLFPGLAQAKPGCRSQACVERVARKQCNQTHVVACIRRAAIHHHQPFADALRVARCESSLDPYNEYVGHHGLYQFLTSTWATTPYRGHWIYSAKWQSLAAMWMWRVGRRSEWQCQLARQLHRWTRAPLLRCRGALSSRTAHASENWAETWAEAPQTPLFQGSSGDGLDDVPCPFEPFKWAFVSAP